MAQLSVLQFPDQSGVNPDFGLHMFFFAHSAGLPGRVEEIGQVLDSLGFTG